MKEIQEGSAALDSRARSNAGEGRAFGDKLTTRHEYILDGLLNAVSFEALARECGVHRHTMADYIHSKPDLEEAYRAGQEALTDRYEETLHRIALSGRDEACALNAIKFYLERRGGKRGYAAKWAAESQSEPKVPVIVVRDVTEEEIAEGEELVRRANAEAEKGLEGVPRG